MFHHRKTSFSIIISAQTTGFFLSPAQFICSCISWRVRHICKNKFACSGFFVAALRTERNTGTARINLWMTFQKKHLGSLLFGMELCLRPAGRSAVHICDRCWMSLWYCLIETNKLNERHYGRCSCFSLNRGTCRWALKRDEKSVNSRRDALSQHMDSAFLRYLSERLIAFDRIVAR